MLLILAVVIGALTGLAVVAFILCTERFGMHLYPAGGAAWRRLLFPVVGSLGIGYLLYRFFPNARGSGVPQTKTALFARDGRITLRTVLGKFFCTSVTLASGIPLGREGPSVQVGAGIASVLGRMLGLSPETVKKLIPVGAAAAIAAAFNTPLAAVLFALEEIMGDLNAPVMAAVVLASATAWVVLRACLGNHPLFRVPEYQLVSPIEFLLYAVLGVAGGLVSAAFTRLLLGMRAAFLRLPYKTTWLHPLAGGLMVGAMGWFVPQVLGVGYLYVGQALNNGIALKLMLLLVVLKLFAVTTSYASGNAGGIFGPALFIGAMLGGSLGTVAHHLLPALTATPGAYALVGMGAVFAGVVRAPMTSVLIIFEMTQDYAVIVPLMLANLVSLFIASQFQRESIYEALTAQDGIHLPAAARNLGSSKRLVSAAIRPAGELLRADMTIQEAFTVMQSSALESCPVLDSSGVIGVASLAQLDGERGAGADRKLDSLIKAQDFLHIHVDESLDVALARMGSTGMAMLPVVSRTNIHNLEGIVTLQDVLHAYGVSAWGGHSTDDAVAVADIPPLPAHWE
ncbi:chloride channel protein [Granulicella mallensis]|uniref:CIC family chloride channel protein n=1 Tax=Granulicella mallensis TaxID=940614 RepID=A0A7W7ZPH9_9BACT|nr:chloride channel protein [Granulicella mallensis]MBB5063697.1 CIC family chloride channel protein [Granulicella mallensis]